MNGPEHYAEAERLLAEAGRMVSSTAQAVGVGAYPASEGLVIISATYTCAQVHATLALAASTYDAAAMRISGQASADWAAHLQPSRECMP